ncbi:GWxTD domain-containing protein [Fodinibius sediminis]|uniref:GWxTD domain-containing protein n=1 Tax=Fodinibius sediminis TaxID=1214077 RepID=UPI00163D4A2D|nr:GWxTD domain-containing protein [Fodinibius sediminis]
MKQTIYSIAGALLFGLLFGSASELRAQQNLKYQQLSFADQRPSQFFDFLILPGQADETVALASVYSFSYSSMPFKKSNESQSSGKKRAFFSPVTMNMEVFSSNESLLKRKDPDISVEQLDPAGRAFWEDTAYAGTYEETQSELTFLYGHLGMELKPGIYTYVLQLKRGDRGDPRTSQTRTIRIKPYSEMTIGNVYLGEKLSSDGSQLQLISMGDNVKYGSDFYALAYLPGYTEEASYSLDVNAISTSRGDTSVTDQLYSQELGTDDLRRGIKPCLNSGRNSKANMLQLSPDPDGFTYALVKIPNSRFPNTSYRITIRENDRKTVSSTTYQSKWLDMPRSLLSLDIATEMLRYMVNDQTLDRLSEGSKEERERKFRAFWKERDPTPDTEYNELMAEYYRRIDYAYRHFTTNNIIGYESDQGKVYIKYGPPNNIERKFPIDGSPVEIWSYPNREFVFRATSGFGDFKLVSQ